MSTKRRPATNAGNTGGSNVLVIDPTQQQAAFAAYGRAVSHYFSMPSPQPLTINSWLGLVATGGAGLGGMITNPTTSTRSRSHHRKATPQQLAALAKARQAQRAGK